MATKETQARWRQKADTTRVELQLPREAMAILDQLAAELGPATRKPVGRSPAVRRLLERCGRLPLERQSANPPGPIPFWRPDSAKPRDPTCQATTSTGARCKSAGVLLVTAMTPAVVGEFCACKGHHAAFNPHPSVVNGTCQPFPTWRDRLGLK